MYKIFNFQLLKRSLIYFIMCLMLGFAFRNVVSINQIFAFYPAGKIEHYMGYILLCSRLVMAMAIIIFLFQDFMDLYGAKYTFIAIRKAHNQRYFYYILMKEWVSLWIYSIVYLASLLLSMVCTDTLQLPIFLGHYLSFILWTWNIFLLSAILGTLLSEQAIYYLLLVMMLLYMLVYSGGFNAWLMDYLNFQKTWLLGELLISFLLIRGIYQVQK